MRATPAPRWCSTPSAVTSAAPPSNTRWRPSSVSRRTPSQSIPTWGGTRFNPYLAYPDKGVILLCRTSNPGGSDLQFLDVGGLKLYEHVARLVAEEWNASGNCGLVVGATFPAEIARVRALIGDMPLLVPGIGAQGGDIAATLAAGLSTRGAGLMINSSRAILYAGKDENFAAAARLAALDTRDAINAQR